MRDTMWLLIKNLGGWHCDTQVSIEEFLGRNQKSFKQSRFHQSDAYAWRIEHFQTRNVKKKGKKCKKKGKETNRKERN